MLSLYYTGATLTAHSNIIRNFLNGTKTTFFRKKEAARQATTFLFTEFVGKPRKLPLRRTIKRRKRGNKKKIQNPARMKCIPSIRQRYYSLFGTL